MYHKNIPAQKCSLEPEGSFLKLPPCTYPCISRPIAPVSLVDVGDNTTAHAPQGVREVFKAAKSEVGAYEKVRAYVANMYWRLCSASVCAYRIVLALPPLKNSPLEAWSSGIVSDFHRGS
jgi:hypothetical protein